MTKILALHKYGFIFSLLLLLTSCKGQTNSVVQKPDNKNTRDSAMQAYLAQEHRFEFKDYKMYYNGQLIKADSVKNIVKLFGKPDNAEELTYSDKPLSLSAKGGNVATDEKGNLLFMYEGEIYPDIEENRNLYIKGGKYISEKDSEGNLIGVVDRFSIQMAPHQNPLKYGDPPPRTKALMNIPPLNGYVLINGILVNKNTQLQDLRNQLREIKNGKMLIMTGTPIIIYEPDPGHSFIEYDSKIDDSQDYIWISFQYDENEENAELISINYYYIIK